MNNDLTQNSHFPSSNAGAVRLSLTMPHPISSLANGAHWLSAFAFLLIWSLIVATRLSGAEAPLYSMDFESAKLDSVPEEFLVLDGGFAVKKEDDNQFLELPGAPLETYGVLFGPNEKEGLAVSARIYGTNRGRRYPAFSVGLNGVAGFRLQVAPAKRSLELFKGDENLWSQPYTWKSGTWTHFRLQLRKVNDTAWQVEGKAWPESDPEPREWMVVHRETTAPYAGRPSIWGKPFSGTPIRFDNLIVSAAQP